MVSRPASKRKISSTIFLTLKNNKNSEKKSNMRISKKVE